MSHEASRAWRIPVSPAIIDAAHKLLTEQRAELAQAGPVGIIVTSGHEVVEGVVVSVHSTNGHFTITIDPPTD